MLKQNNANRYSQLRKRKMFYPNYAQLSIKLTVVLMFSKIFTSQNDEPKLELFGVREGDDYLKVPDNEPFTIIVFGKNLPRTGYYLTSTGQCKDWNNSVISIKEYIPLTVGKYANTSLNLPVRSGIPFNDSLFQFQLCNKGDVSIKYPNYLIILCADEPWDWLTLIICVFCLMFSACCSGLNFAFMRLSINDVMMIAENGDEPHKTHAAKILPYRRQSNWLICTFAVANTLSNTMLTIKIEQMWRGTESGAVVGYVVPTIFILLFAEVLPQAVCNRRGLMLAARSRYLTLVLMVLVAVAAWPLSKLIDWMLGREVREVYSLQKLNNLIRMQALRMEKTQGEILARIIDFPKRKVFEIMTRIDDCFVLSSQEKMNNKLLVTIVEKGYTRIPVYTGRNRMDISKVLNVKDLVCAQLAGEPTVGQVISHLDADRTQMRFVLSSTRCQQLMQEMTAGDVHICAVIQFQHGRYEIVGLITFEDVLEELFGDIEDDSDQICRNRRAGTHKDQKTLDWFRRADDEPWLLPSSVPKLTVNQQLQMIQVVMEMCPDMVHLGFDVHRTRMLLSTNKIRLAKKNEILNPNILTKHLIIVFCGSIYVTGDSVTSMRFIMDPISSNFRPYVTGLSLIRKLYATYLGSRSYNVIHNADSEENDLLTALSDKVAYYKISVDDITAVLRETEELNLRRKASPEYIDENNGTLVKYPHSQEPFPRVSSVQTPKAERLSDKTQRSQKENENEKTKKDEKEKLLKKKRGSGSRTPSPSSGESTKSPAEEEASTSSNEEADELLPVDETQRSLTDVPLLKRNKESKKDKGKKKIIRNSK